MRIEEIIAEELAERVKPRFDSRQGVIEFFENDIEIDYDVTVSVTGSVEYETQYEEATNYTHISYVLVWIDEVVGCTADPKKVAKYLTESLYG